MPYCSNCGNLVSDQATMCPNCGHPAGAAVVSHQRATANYAGFWRRFLALLVDAIILSLVFLPLTSGNDDNIRRIYITNAPSTLLSFLYRWLMIAFANGQTLGKMLVGVRIQNPDGSRVTVGQAAAREGMAIVSSIPVGLGYLWAAWDPEKRTWHDMVANTRAFRAR